MAAADPILSLSTLQARKRPAVEDAAFWEAKKERLTCLESAFVTSAAAENLARLLAEQAKLEDFEEALEEKRENLSRVDQLWLETEQIVREKSKLFASKIREILECKEMLRKADSLSQDARTDDNEAELVNRIEKLSSEVALLKSQCSEARLNHARTAEISTKLTEDLHVLEMKEKELKQNIQVQHDREGPERENLSLLASFVAVKSQIHEKLAGHKVTSIYENGTTNIEVLDGEATIQAAFVNGQLTDIGVVSDKKHISMLGADLVEDATTKNDAIPFVSGIKERILQEQSLNRDLMRLGERGQNGPFSFTLDFNQNTRVATLYIEKEDPRDRKTKSIYARLRVPSAYGQRPLDLIKVDKPEGSRKMKYLEDQLKDIVLKHGKGQLLEHWIDGFAGIF